MRRSVPSRAGLTSWDREAEEAQLVPVATTPPLHGAAQERREPAVWGRPGRDLDLREHGTDTGRERRAESHGATTAGPAPAQGRDIREHRLSVRPFQWTLDAGRPDTQRERRRRTWPAVRGPKRRHAEAGSDAEDAGAVAGPIGVAGGIAIDAPKEWTLHERTHDLPLQAALCPWSTITGHERRDRSASQASTSQRQDGCDGERPSQPTHRSSLRDEGRGAPRTART